MVKNPLANAVASGGAGLLLGTIQRSAPLAELPENNIRESALDLMQSADKSSSYTDLLNQFDTTNFLKTNWTTDDLTGMSKGEAAGNIILNGLQGGMAGAEFGTQIMPGIGTGIGAAAGTVADILGSSIAYALRKNKASNEAEQGNYLAKVANEMKINNMQDSAINIGKNNRNSIWLNASTSAYGGPLNTESDFDNGVRFITEGGSHEQNPLGGVLQGIAQDGLPNLVEEGEVIYKDYVYSNRLKVPDADKEMLGLKKNKDYTFADAATQIQKESEERPNDAISKRSLNEMMGRLQGAQEEYKDKLKLKKVKSAINKMTPDELAMFMQQLEQPQQMQPMIGMQSMQPMQQTQSEIPMFAIGGLLGHTHAGPWLEPQTSYLFATPTYYPDATDVAGAIVNNRALQSQYLPINSWKNFATEVGMAQRPLPIDETIDILPEITAKSNRRASLSAPRKGLTITPISASDILSKRINSNSTPITLETPEYIKSPITGISVNPVSASDVLDKGIPELKKSLPKATIEGENLPKETKPNLSPSIAQALRASSVFGALAGAVGSLFDKPNYSNIARAENAMAQVPRVSAGHVGQRLAYTPIDINYLMTQTGNQGIGARRALVEAGAGPQSIIASNYATQLGMGQNFLSTLLQNEAKKAQAAEFNRGTDITNIGNDLNADLANQRRDIIAADFLMKTGQLRDAELATLQNQRSAQITNAYNQLHNLGTDMLNREQAAAVAGSLGVTYNDLMNALLANMGARKTACGGKLNTKKGGKHA